MTHLACLSRNIAAGCIENDFFSFVQTDSSASSGSGVGDGGSKKDKKSLSKLSFADDEDA